MNKRRIVSFFICVILTIISTSVLGWEKVFAEDGSYGQVWIDPNVSNSSGPSTPSGPGFDNNCDGNKKWWLSECTGGSWIYYKAVEEMEHDNIPFGGTYTSLLNNTSVSVNIPKECQGKRMSDGTMSGGFWHYGINGKAKSNTGHFYTSPDYNRHLYHVDTGTWGHWWTMGYNTNYLNSPNVVYDSLSIGHTIYDGGIEAFKSTESASVNDVAEDFYQACWEDKHLSSFEKQEYCGDYPHVPKGTYMFCFDKNAKKFYGETGASVSGSGGSDSTTTGIVDEGSQTVADNAGINADIHDVVTIIFTHNVYSGEANTETTWSVGGPYVDGGGVNGYSIIEESTDFAAVRYGTAQFEEEKEGEYYVPTERQGSDENGSYILRDEITIMLYVGGTYTFCEDLTTSNLEVFTSKACVVLQVSEDVVPPIPPEIIDGYSCVLSQVINGRLHGFYSGWRGLQDISGQMIENTTYAMPGDSIAWLNYYCPAAQPNLVIPVVFGKGGAVIGKHGEHIDSFTANENKTMCEYYNLDNKYNIFTTSPSGWDFPDEKSKDFSMDCGSGEERVHGNNHTVSALEDVGNQYFDLIKTIGSTPNYSKITKEYHEWDAWHEEKVFTVIPTGLPWPPYVMGYTTVKVLRHYFHPNNPTNTGDYEVEPLASASYVRIPYNFINTTSFNLKWPTDGVLYPGEEVNVENTVVDIGVKENEAVEASYTTVVDGDPDVGGAMVKLIAYVSTNEQKQANEENSGSIIPSSGYNLCNGNYVKYITEGVDEDYRLCEEVKSYTGRLNKTGSLNGWTYNDVVEGVSFDGVYKVFDARAGDWFCMTLGVYPATSGGDTNLNPKGDNSWYIHTPKCIQIAKKPTFQVWGAGMYSAGDISTIVSEKQTIYKKYTYNSVGVRTFGSWVEENITADGKVKYLASGAGLGHGTNGIDGLEGKAENNFCKRMVPLSFANYSNDIAVGICWNGTSSGMANIKSATFGTAANVGAMSLYWGEGTLNPDGLYIADLGDDSISYGDDIISPTGKSIRVINVDNDVSIGSSFIKQNYTRVLRAKNVNINGNIVYDDSARYGSSNEIPKVIMYVSGNINISCGVGRIDAVLLAEGTINDCSDSDEDINDEARSNQLIINGTVIANELLLGRTYGNSIGVANGGYIGPSITGSETPAEIINYDTSIILWGSSMAGSAESNTLTVTYQHELAPRY